MVLTGTKLSKEKQAFITCTLRWFMQCLAVDNFVKDGKQGLSRNSLAQNLQKFRANKRELSRLVGCEMKIRSPIFKTEMLICQSRVVFDVKTLSGKLTHLLRKENAGKGLYGNESSMFDSGPRITCY